MPERVLQILSRNLLLINSERMKQMDKKYGSVLSREELIEKYNLSEDDQVYLLDIFEDIEKEIFRFLSYHL